MRILFFILAIVVSSCDFSGKNSVEPLKMDILQEGLTFTDTNCVMGETPVTTCEVPLDTVIEIQFIGVAGFETVDGKWFVGTMMEVYDTSGNILFRHDDLFLDFDTIGFDPVDVKRLIGINLETGKPMIPGLPYLWKIKIWDKKGKGVLFCETLIKVKSPN
jgi:hypothetical protein